MGFRLLFPQRLPSHTPGGVPSGQAPSETLSAFSPFSISEFPPLAFRFRLRTPAPPEPRPSAARILHTPRVSCLRPLRASCLGGQAAECLGMLAADGCLPEPGSPPSQDAGRTRGGMFSAWPTACSSHKAAVFEFWEVPRQRPLPFPLDQDTVEPLSLALSPRTPGNQAARVCLCLFHGDGALLNRAFGAGRLSGLQGSAVRKRVSKLHP